MKPLDNIKVIEFATHVAVPSAARLLADWGAQVIKVENISGDLWRYYGLNCSTPITAEENPIFDIPNSNKKLVSINAKTEEGYRILKQLLANADIFMTNVRQKALDKLHLDYDSLASDFPKLVYLHFTGYGYNGPLAANPGFDVAAFWSSGGMLGGWPMKGDMPFAPSTAFGDTSVSAMVASGVLAGLIHRLQTGKGIRLTTSLFATALWYNFGDVITTQPQYNATRPCIYDDTVNPFLNFYLCADGRYVFLAGLEFDRAYAKCLTAMGLEKYIDDPRFNTLNGYTKNKNAFLSLMRATMQTKTSEEWLQLFTEQDIVIQKVTAPQELYLSEQAQANGYFSQIDYEVSGHKTIMPNTPIQFFDMETGKTEKTGDIGCDTVEILQELGYSTKEIETLSNKGVVRFS